MSIGTFQSNLHEDTAARFLNSVRKYVTNDLVDKCCQCAGHRWRQRLWPPLITILACLWKQLMATASARQVEDWARSLSAPLTAGKVDGSDFCAARARLPLEVFKLLVGEIGRRTVHALAYTFHGLPVSIVDGSTLRTPNTPDNERAFGRSSNQSGKSRRPLLRLVILTCAGCSAILDAAHGAYIVSEQDLFLELLSRISSPRVLLADSAYCTFLLISKTHEQGSHFVTRLHHKRKGQRVQQLGAGDELQVWKRPTHGARPELLAQCPEKIKVRVIAQKICRPNHKPVQLTIVTTLLDPVEFPADELIDLYLRRWNVELDFRTLKTHYGLSQLSGQSADVVCKEIWSTLLAHNCVAAIMVESGAEPRKVSHTRVRSAVLSFGYFMAWATDVGMVQLYRLLLRLIPRMELDQYPRLPQPRGIVQRNHNYPVLTTSRAEWRRREHGVA